jgi:hypothetical protein
MKRILAFALLALAALVAGCTRGPSPQESRGVTLDTEAQTPKDFGVYHAIIIGINDYERWPRLRFAEQDANEIAELLISGYGFSAQRVTKLTGSAATRQSVLSTLRRKLQDLTDQDNLLIYYAGHGQLDPLTEKGYWVPVDGDLFDESSWIPFTQVTDYLSAPNVRAKNIVVLTDSCYGGALARSGPTPGHPTPGDGDTDRYVAELAKRAAKRSRQVLASGGYEQVPDESMFATLLKRALAENKYPAVDVELLFFTSIYPQIRIVGQQEPRLARVISGPDVDGQFVLLRSVVADSPQSDDSRESEVVADRDTPADRETPEDRGNSGDRDPPADRDTRTDQDAVAARPVIETFELSPSKIRRGENVTLTWRTAHAQRVEIRERSSPGDAGATSRSLAVVHATGSHDVKPKVNTQYTLVASDAAGNQVSADYSVIVKAPLPVITELGVQNPEITAGESTSLFWNVRGAKRVALRLANVGDDSARTVSAKEAREIRPPQTSTYVLLAYNEDEELVSDRVVVKVNPATPRIAMFTSDSIKVNAGQAVTLSWKTENATQVELVGVGPVAAAGTHQVTPTQSTHYILVARNGESETKQDVKIEVARTRPPLGDRLGVLVGAADRRMTELAVATDRCKEGYVWREAYPGDHVCVTPQVRAQTVEDNNQADARREPGGGAYGPNTCRSGFVWRDARPGDYACVTPATRSQVAADNAQATARRAGYRN